MRGLALLAAAAGIVLLLVVFLSQSGRPSPEPSGSIAAEPAPVRERFDELAGGSDLDRDIEPARRAPVEIASTPTTPTPSADEPATLRVRCVDRDQHGIAEVHVVASRYGEGPYQRKELGRQRTDSAGRVAFDLSAPWPFVKRELQLVLVPPEGWAHVGWRGPLPDRELVIELVPGARLRGRVRRSDGSPVPDEARLQLEWTNGDRQRASNSFDIEDGRYETGLEIAGEIVSAGISAPGSRYISQTVSGLRVDPGAQIDRDFVFDFGCACRLRFLDAETSAPIAGATVKLSAAATTDQAGRVEFPDAIGPGESAPLRFEHPDFAPLKTRLACGDPPVDLALDFSVGRGLSLAGVVQDPRGRPEAGVLVRCGRYAASESGTGSRLVLIEKSAKTDAHGRFAVHGLPAGSDYQVHFEREGQVIGSETIALPGADERGTWIVHDPVQAFGSVLDHEDRAVGGVEVRAHARASNAWRTARTQDDGSFRLEGLFPGTWLATVFGSSGAKVRSKAAITGCRKLTSTWFEVEPVGAQRIALRLAPPRSEPCPEVRFTLRLFDEASRAPVGNFDMLFLGGVDNEHGIVLGGGATGTEGFEHVLTEGTYDFIVVAHGYEPGRARVVLDPARAPVQVEIGLRPEP